MLQNMSLQKKLLLGMGFTMLISVAVGAYIFISVLSLQKSLEYVESVNQVQSEVYALERDLAEVKTSLADFLNSGDLAKRDLYLKEQAQLEAEKDGTIALLKTIGGDYTAKGETIYTDIAAWKDTIVAKQLDYMTRPETVDLARLIQASEENAAIQRNLTEHLNAINTPLTELLHDSAQSQRRVMTTTRMVVIVGAILMFAATVAVSIFLVQMISKPLARLVGVTNRLVQKQWDVSVTDTDRKDEVGQMASALLLFRNNGLENEKLQEQQRKEDEARLQRAQKIEALVARFRDDSSATTNALEQATTDMQSASDMMSHIASKTMDLSSRVTEAASETGTNVQSVSAATEELTASINEISVQLNKTSQQSVDVQRAAETAVTQMKTLEETANAVGSVIQIISDIAEQTNLLALNATIESARAGESGKGFAVVANEVKTLANETAKATEKVREQIESMQAQAQDAVGMIDNISTVIEDLTAASASIAAAMEEQSSATQEISRSVANAAVGTEDVVRNITEVNHSTEETGTTSSKVREVSEELAKRSETLKTSIQTFIESIKTA
ncbi:methyl-accepting chemotaxis protein [Micavibrio aeruginosavorus]|uniref:methyl-accepting chemotaxis protein n=1 Tax=Micavibrio aeruginosavorus TaxID=349221 RepID=UPI003F4A881B